MSLGIAFKGPEGIVLAADSRVTLMAQVQQPNLPTPMVLPASYDNATKLLRIKGQRYVGAVTYGAGAIGVTEPRTDLTAGYCCVCAAIGVGRKRRPGLPARR